MDMRMHEIYVKALLRHTDRLMSSGYSGARWNVVDELADLGEAIKVAGLTAKQQAVIDYYRQEYKEDEIAEILGISQQMVSKHIHSAIRKIATIYSEWEEDENGN